MSDFMQGLNSLTAEMTKVREEFQRRGEEQIKKALEGFFTEFPQVEKIFFSGYVPYFNDGDACEFNFNGIYLAGDTTKSVDDLTDEDADTDTDVDDGDSDRFWSDDWTGVMPHGVRQARDNLNRAFNDMEDVIEQIFGSHFRAVATRQGITVTEYTDHD